MDAFAENDFEISSVEMKKFKRRQSKLDRDRDVCKQYLTAAKTVLDELGNKAGGKLIMYGALPTATLLAGVGKKSQSFAGFVSVNSLLARLFLGR